MIKDDIEMAEIDHDELKTVSPAVTITITGDDSDEMIDETVEILSPSSVNDRTFDQVELESKESSDLASPEKIEELSDSKSNVVEVLDETFDEPAEPADLRTETDDVETVSVMGDISSTKPVEDEFDGDATAEVEDTNDATDAVNPFSPTVRLPSSFISSEEASDVSPKSSHSPNAADKSAQVFQDKFDIDFDVEFKMPVVPRRSDAKMNFRNIDEIGDSEEKFQNGCKRIFRALFYYMTQSFHHGIFYSALTHSCENR